MNFKLILGAAVLLAALVFSVQNAGVVDVQILVWKFSLSLSLVIFATLAAGLIGGWAVTSALRCMRQSSKDSAPTMRTSVNGLVLIGENKWQHGMATFCKPFTNVSIRSFGREDAGDTRKRLGEAWRIQL